MSMSASRHSDVFTTLQSASTALVHRHTGSVGGMRPGNEHYRRRPRS